jgi:hypothetical protein
MEATINTNFDFLCALHDKPNKTVGRSDLHQKAHQIMGDRLHRVRSTPMQNS